MKTLNTFFVLCFGILFYTGVNAQILDIGDTLSINSLNYGLVGYYPFTGNAGDSSGTGNHGTEKNGVSLTTDRFGNPNSAYLFDGTDDYIEIADDNTLDLTDSFSITLWMNQYNSTAGGYRLFDKTTSGINDGYNFDTYGSSGRSLRLTGGQSNAQASVTFPLNSWNQVLVIHYKDSTYFYQNSSFIGKDVQKNILSNSLTALIGISHANGAVYYGKMDEIRVYNRALCDLEIKVVYGLVLKLGANAAKPSVCNNTSTNIHISNPQPYIQYRLLKAIDSTLVGAVQSSPCSDTLRFSTGNLTQNTSFIFRAYDPVSTQTMYLDTVITVTIGQSYNDTVDTAVCGGAGVFFNGQTRYNTGYYYGAFKTTTGCDSLITLHLVKEGANVYPKTLTICNGDSILISNKYRKTAGTYYDTIKITGQCDSVVATTLKLINPVSAYQYKSICLNDSLLVNGRYIKNPGYYYDTLTGFSGCDSILTTELAYQSVDTATRFVSICSNDSIKISSKYYKTAGTYKDTIFFSNCVDSINTIQLSIVNSQLITTSITLCKGDSVTVNGKKIGSSGVFYDSLKNKNGCDSIAEYVVTAHNTGSYTFKFTFCFKDSIFFDGTFYSKDTIFYDTIKTTYGCDSLLITVLDAGGVPPSLVDSALFCEEIPATIDAGDYLSYLWSTGDNQRHLTTYTEGLYWVTVTDSFHCTFTDSSRAVERCSPQVYVPSAFTPNRDGKNDFLIFNAYNVDQIDFQVFDRWGELVFQTKDKNAAWDGTFNGEALPNGLYFWVVNYRGRNMKGISEIKNATGLLYIIQ